MRQIEIQAVEKVSERTGLPCGGKNNVQNTVREPVLARIYGPCSPLPILYSDFFLNYHRRHNNSPIVFDINGGLDKGGKFLSLL